MKSIKNEGQIWLSAVSMEKDTNCDLQMVSLFYLTLEFSAPPKIQKKKPSWNYSLKFKSQI